jgi:hypothetical protein
VLRHKREKRTKSKQRKKMSLLDLARTVKHEGAALQPIALLEGLTVEAFFGSGRTLRIYSRVLNEEVLLAADNAAVSPSETRTVYRASELPELLGITPDGLRLLHEVKTVFPDAVIISEAES